MMICSEDWGEGHGECNQSLETGTVCAECDKLCIKTAAVNDCPRRQPPNLMY